MNKRVASGLSLLLVFICSLCLAQNNNESWFTISRIRPSGEKVIIGDRTYTEGDKFRVTRDGKTSIIWNDVSIFYAKCAGEPFVFSKDAFESKKAKNIQEFLYHHEKGSSRKSADIVSGVSDRSRFPMSRLALVVGNSNYMWEPNLKNSIGDAKSVSEALLSLGFDVITAYDSGASDLKAYVDEFYKKGSKYDVTLFYFSGHGVQDNSGTNYLVPSDVDTQYSTCREQLFSVTDLVRLANSSEDNNDIIIIDACRDIKLGWSRSINEIAANQIETPSGVCLMYSTRSGYTASDGDNDNSPFTTAFVKEIERPNKDLDAVLSSIRYRVLSQTNYNQDPVFQSGLGSRFFFYRDSFEQSDIASTNTISTIGENAPEYVDLGLPSGIKWATCNIGASSPEDYGHHYAWGELLPKQKYSWKNYRFRYGGTDEKSFVAAKYVLNPNNGDVDNLKVLSKEDDIATHLFGTHWKIPTQKDFQELIEHCEWVRTDNNGHHGYLITSKINRNSIFLPANGRFVDELLGADKVIFYWTSSLDVDLRDLSTKMAGEPEVLLGGTSSYYFLPWSRYEGGGIRPVYDQNTGSILIDWLLDVSKTDMILSPNKVITIEDLISRPFGILSSECKKASYESVREMIDKALSYHNWKLSAGTNRSISINSFTGYDMSVLGIVPDSVEASFYLSGQQKSQLSAFSYLFEFKQFNEAKAFSDKLIVALESMGVNMPVKNNDIGNRRKARYNGRDIVISMPQKRSATVLIEIRYMEDGIWIE